MQKLTIKIEGMHCEGCKRRVENVLKTFGLKNISVDLNKKQAEVNAKDSVDVGEVVAALNDIGFSASV